MYDDLAEGLQAHVLLDIAITNLSRTLMFSLDTFVFVLRRVVKI
jgi:hypothetical protein